MISIVIFTDADLASESDKLIQEEYLSEYFGDRIFIACEDGKLLMNEEEDTLFIQEYFENV